MVLSLTLAMCSSVTPGMRPASLANNGILTAPQLLQFNSPGSLLHHTIPGTRPQVSPFVACRYAHRKLQAKSQRGCPNTCREWRRSGIQWRCQTRHHGRGIGKEETDQLGTSPPDARSQTGRQARHTGIQEEAGHAEGADIRACAGEPRSLRHGRMLVHGLARHLHDPRRD